MLKYSKLQKLTLTDILNTAGLSPQRIMGVFSLLAEKPYRVQLAFYYRACGATYKDICYMVGSSRSTLWEDVNIKCLNIKKYLKSPEKTTFLSYKE